MPRRSRSTAQPLVLPSRPCSEGLVEMAEDLHALRPVVPAVVVHPAAHRRVGEPRQILQTLVVPGGGHPPFTDVLAVMSSRAGSGSQLLPCNAGPPRFLDQSVPARRPLTPRRARRVHTCPLLPRRWQASPHLAGWPLSLRFTRPIRVHLRYGSRVRLPRLRRLDYSSSRSGRYLLNGQFAGSPPFR